jgi:hypothetical protein
LDTFEQLHQYALLYNLAANRLAHDRALEAEELDQLLYTKAPAVSRHLMWLVDDIGGASPRTQSPMLRQMSRWVLRTYSDLYLNPLTATAPWNDTWLSRHPDGWKVGGTVSTGMLAFLTNRYTWVSMRADPASQVEDLTVAVTAAQDSHSPCRVVLLAQDSDQIRDMIRISTPGVRKHILVTISPHAAPLFTLDDADFPASGVVRPLHAATMPVLMILIENTSAPGYDISHIHTTLEGERGIIVHPMPQSYGSTPPDITIPPPARQMQDRHHPLLRSSQTWCRAAHHYTPPPHACDQQEPVQGRISDRRSASDRLNPVLGLLGANPRALGPDIASHGGLSPTLLATIKQMSLLVLNTSVALYQRSEAYGKWRRKT